MTASAHVLVFRPLIAMMRGRGDEVGITARDYAQTLQLLAAARARGRRGDRPARRPLAHGKARAMWSRLRALRRWARGRDFDVALAHGSHELTMTARRLGIPSTTTFDYEWAWRQHQLGCRAATRVAVPDAIPVGSTGALRRRAPETLQYQGLKESTILADFVPDPNVLEPWEGRLVAGARRAAPAARRVAVPPAGESAVPSDARACRPARRRAGDRAASHGGTARVRALAGPAVGDPPRRRPWTRRA